MPGMIAAKGRDDVRTESVEECPSNDDEEVRLCTATGDAISALTKRSRVNGRF